MGHTEKIPQVWGVSDGRAGNENQILGVIEALKRKKPLHYEIIRLKPRKFLNQLISSIFSPHPRMLKQDSPSLWPDLWIACGRQSLPYTQKSKKWSQGKTFTIQLLNPRNSLQNYDLVFLPEHDGIRGENIFPLIGTPNRITPQKLTSSLPDFQDRLSQLPNPKIAILVGGDTKRNKLRQSDHHKILESIKTLSHQKMGLLITTSRRTPKSLIESLKTLSCEPNIWLWTGKGENPYFAFLASAEAILITSDSTNMLTEACSTGKPVYMLPLSGNSNKFSSLYRSLQKHCGLRLFQGEIESWSYPPLAETERCAEKIWEAYTEQS